MKSHLPYLLLIILVSASHITAAQTRVTDHSVKVPADRISKFADSIKTRIARDTSKFNPLDLTSEGKDASNVLNYSKLFIINNKLSYKLDVVNSRDVALFVREFLAPAKIEEIAVLRAPYSTMAYGPKGSNGVVLIQLKSTAKFDPAVVRLAVTVAQGN